MNGRLQGFLSFLDLLAEGQRRQADLIAGGGFTPEPQLQPVVAPATGKDSLKPASDIAFVRGAPEVQSLDRTLTGLFQGFLQTETQEI